VASRETEACIRDNIYIRDKRDEPSQSEEVTRSAPLLLGKDLHEVYGARNTYDDVYGNTYNTYIVPGISDHKWIMEIYRNVKIIHEDNK